MRTIDILWTAGWDSTFRVLDACVNQGHAIRPHYIIDRGRPSHAVEVMTVGLLAQAITERCPQTRIAPLRLTERTDIPAMPDLTRAFERLRDGSHLGEQYDWLARYALATGIEGLELCIHRDDKAYVFVAPRARPAGAGGEHWHELSRGLDDDVERVFAHHRYPVLDLTKVAMEERARRDGFLDILERTWFCHTPTTDGQPCGTCNPCCYTIEEGLARRLPPAALRRHRTRRTLLTRALRRLEREIHALRETRLAGW